MRIDRLNSMEKFIMDNGSASLEDMVRKFHISINTVRRDLGDLLVRGTIKKVYGGVMSTAASEKQAYASRQKVNISVKQTIGRLAAQLVRNDDTVYVDAGTTTAQVIPYLGEASNVTIISSNLKALYEASKHPALSIIAIGGHYNRSKDTFMDLSAVERIAMLNFDLILLGATGVSLESGLSTNAYFEVEMKRWLVKKKTCHVALMADSGKFGKTALNSYCSFDDLNTVVSECMLPEAYMKRMTENGTMFICPGYKNREAEMQA